MKDEEVINRLWTSLCLFTSKEAELLITRTSERSITAKVMQYMSYIFNEYDVDAEYNLDFSKPQVQSKRIKDEINSKSRLIVPDIIVHKRGSTEYNLLALEYKIYRGFGLKIEHDILKLKKLTKLSGRMNFKYQLGALVILELYGESPNYKVKLFKNGREVQNLIFKF